MTIRIKREAWQEAGYQLMQGSSESPTGPQTSHYARAVYTSHDEAFSIELNIYSVLGQVFGQRGTVQYILSPDCYNIWMWNDRMSMRFEHRVSALIYGYSGTSNDRAKQCRLFLLLLFSFPPPSFQLPRSFLTGQDNVMFSKRSLFFFFLHYL